MSQEVQSISAEQSVLEAQELMRRHRIRHLVVMEGKQPIGILSERDLLRVPTHLNAGDQVRRTQFTAPPSATVREAANLMRGNWIDAVAVVEGQKVVGILTTSDMLDLIGRGEEGHAPVVARDGKRRRRSASVLRT